MHSGGPHDRPQHVDCRLVNVSGDMLNIIGAQIVLMQNF